MRRSQINAILDDADRFLKSNGFHLPPFAYWDLQTWKSRRAEASEIIDHRLGWDITDFGLGDYAQFGLFLFTLRNGNVHDLGSGSGKIYAEKVMIVEPGQITPLHFHWQKTEDIINRAGGELEIMLYNSTDDEELDDTEVRIRIDSVERIVPAGGKITLGPGESVTLPVGLYHEFCARRSRVLVGEVSTVNDDATDNRFFREVGRFPEIEEDEPPLYLLVGDYERLIN